MRKRKAGGMRKKKAGIRRKIMSRYNKVFK